MSLEDSLFRQRLERIPAIEQLGFHAYGHRFDCTHTVPQIIEHYQAWTQEQLTAERIPVRIAGRIMTVRRMGKAGFISIQQLGQRLQLYLKKDEVSEAHYSLYEGLDLGDIIGVEGYLFRTRTNELSVHVEKLDFLSKILLNLPEKYHGLEDVETRYRMRYVDMISNPEVQTVFRTRAKIVASLRRELDARGFLEVETPMMQPVHGGATARPFVTHHNTLDVDLYLRIAPELYLKRLVVGGLERVYEINRNFRNEGISVRHNPEFTMLEFYQAYTDFHGMMDLSEELLRAAALAATGSTTVTYQGQQLDFSHLRRLTMREAVVECMPEKPTLEQVSDPAWLAQQMPGATPGAALVHLFERYAEEQLIQPTIIYGYPVEASPLAKNNAQDPAFVDRFEIYAAGMEIGNAYTELNDPQEQRRRFESQVEAARKGDEEAQQMDEDYLRALCYGLPPTGGEGIGIDRLTMILTDSRSIRDVILFPLLRPESDIGAARLLKDNELQENQ